MCFPQPDRDTEWWREQRSNANDTKKYAFLYSVWMLFKAILLSLSSLSLSAMYIYATSLFFHLFPVQCNNMHVDIKWIRFYLIQLYIDICICCWNSRTSWTWKPSSMFDFFLSFVNMSFKGNDFLFTSLLESQLKENRLVCLALSLSTINKNIRL